MHICFFDIDGTLLRSGGAGSAAMEASLVEEFGLPGVAGRVEYSGRTDRAIMRDLLRLHELDDSETNVQTLISGYLKRLPDALHAKDGKVLPGIVELLAELSTRTEVALGLLTGNIRAGAEKKLGHFGLVEFFPFGGFGDRHFERDDVAREAMLAVQDHLRREMNGERVWVIGDTPLDIRCARAIDAKAAAVATGWHSRDELADCEPDLLLDDFSDPQQLLAALQ